MNKTLENHQFIYGQNKEERRRILENIANDNQVEFNENQPISIYIDECILPHVDNISNNIDWEILPIIINNYLNFTITYHMMEKVKKTEKLDILEAKIKILLDKINNLYLNGNFKDIESLDELIGVLKNARNFYKMEYEKMVQTGIFDMNIMELPIPFLELHTFVRHYKNMLNTNNLSIMIDQQQRMPFTLQETINGMMKRSINGDFSIKVACNPYEWNSHYDLKGNLLILNEDYTIINIEEYHDKIYRKG